MITFPPSATVLLTFSVLGNRLQKARARLAIVLLPSPDMPAPRYERPSTSSLALHQRLLIISIHIVIVGSASRQLHLSMVMSFTVLLYLCCPGQTVNEGASDRATERTTERASNLKLCTFFWNSNCFLNFGREHLEV